MLIINNIKNTISNKFLKFSIAFSMFLSNGLAFAQKSIDSPFDTGDMLGNDVKDKSFIEQFKYIILVIMQVALILAMIGLIVYCVWQIVSALKSASKSGEWNDFFMNLVMCVIGIVAAVAIAGLGWTWLDTLKV